MKVLQQAQKNLAIYGIGPHRRLFNLRNLLAILLFGMGTTLSCMHLFCEVKTLEEYAESIFMTVSFVAVTSNFIYIVYKMHRIYDCFDEAEKMINDREFCGSFCTIV